MDLDGAEPTAHYFSLNVNASGESCRMCSRMYCESHVVARRSFGRPRGGLVIWSDVLKRLKIGRNTFRAEVFNFATYHPVPAHGLCGNLEHIGDVDGVVMVELYNDRESCV